MSDGQTHQSQYQIIWDEHLIRNWYVGRLRGMRDLEADFHAAFGVWPRVVGLARSCPKSNIAVWKFIESMPTVLKAVGRYHKNRAGEIAKKMNEMGIKNRPIPGNIRNSSDIAERRKTKSDIISNQIVAKAFKSHSPGEQWGVCK